MTSAMVSRRTRFSRLRRLLWGVLLAVVVLTVLPVVCLRWIPPPTSAFILEKRIAKFLRGGPQPLIRYRWVGWESISPQMRLAVVAAEDQKFPHHWGFDFDSITDAVQHEGPRGRLRGASTITQQVARNLFLWPGRSYVRKGLEAYFTVVLEWLVAEAADSGGLLKHCPVWRWHLRDIRGQRDVLWQAPVRVRATGGSPPRGGAAKSHSAPRPESVCLRARARWLDRGADGSTRRPRLPSEPLSSARKKGKGTLLL